MRNFYGDLLYECNSVKFERIALTPPDSVMVVSHVRATCVTQPFMGPASARPNDALLQPGLLV